MLNFDYSASILGHRRLRFSVTDQPYEYKRLLMDLLVLVQ